MNNVKFPPIHFPNAKVTSRGWVDPETGHLLVAIRDLDKKRKALGLDADVIVETIPDFNEALTFEPETEVDKTKDLDLETLKTLIDAGAVEVTIEPIKEEIKVEKTKKEKVEKVKKPSTPRRKGLNKKVASPEKE